MITFELLNLHCSKTDNNNNNSKIEETFLPVDNGRFQGFSPESVINESDWNINAEIYT
jgi:hypothetical protein